MRYLTKATVLAYREQLKRLTFPSSRTQLDQSQSQVGPKVCELCFYLKAMVYGKSESGVSTLLLRDVTSGVSDSH